MSARHQAKEARHPTWQDAWLASGSNPYLFATGVLGFMPYDAELATLTAAEFSERFGPDAVMLEKWQDEFLRPENFFTDPAGRQTDNPRHSVRSGHGVGKGFVIAVLAIWFPLTHYDSKAVLTANSQDQLRDNNWPEIKKCARRLPAELAAQLDIQEEQIKLKAAPEMAFVVRRTASKANPEALQGIHAKHVLYLVDEASGIFEVVFEVAQGSLSTPGAICVLFSNPTRTTGFFHATHHKLRERWKTRVVNCEDVPRARGHIEDIVKLYGKDSNKYRVRVKGEFPTQDDEIVISLEKVNAAIGRDVVRSNVFPVWGLDPGRFGDDPSALMGRQGNTLLSHLTREWRGLDGPQLAGRVIKLYNETPNDDKPKEICVDVIGIGASAYDHMRLEGSPVREITTGVNVAEAAAISETEHRLRDELWFRGRAWFNQLDCRIEPLPHDPATWALIEKLIGELTGITYDYTVLGKHVVISKKELRRVGIPSPNLADAFLLTLAAGIYPRSNPHRRAAGSDEGSWKAA